MKLVDFTLLIKLVNIFESVLVHNKTLQACELLMVVMLSN